MADLKELADEAAKELLKAIRDRDARDIAPSIISAGRSALGDGGGAGRGVDVGLLWDANSRVDRTG